MGAEPECMEAGQHPRVGLKLALGYRSLNARAGIGPRIKPFSKSQRLHVNGGM
jgi:hypothetical protein